MGDNLLEDMLYAGMCVWRGGREGGKGGCVKLLAIALNKSQY